MWGSYNSQTVPRYDLNIGYGPPRWGAYDVAEIRAQNPTAILFMTPGARIPGDPVPWRHGNLSYGQGITEYPGGSDPAIGTVPPFQASQRVHNHLGQPQRCANYAQAGVAEHVADIMAQEAKAGGLFTDGWDGVATDGWSHPIGESWYCGSNPDLDRNGQVDDIEVARTGFHRGLERFGNRLRGHLPGMLIGGNGPWYKPHTWRGVDPDGWATTFADFSNFEHLNREIGRTDSWIAQADGWMARSTGRPRVWSTVMTALDASNNVAPASTSETDPHAQRSCRFGLTLALMTTSYYLCYPNYSHGAWWWMDEYRGGPDIDERGWLGQPLGPPQRLANGVWRRDFQGGVALNNPNSGSATVTLGVGFRLINGPKAPSVNTGAVVQSVTLSGVDGRVLVRGDFVGTPHEPSRGELSFEGGGNPLAPGAGGAGGGAIPGAAGGSGVSPKPTSPVAGRRRGVRIRSFGFRRNQVLRGARRWRVRTSGAVRRVEFYVNGRRRWTDRRAPFVFRDKRRGKKASIRLRRGRHRLAVKVVGAGGIAKRGIRIRVAPPRRRAR